MAVVTLWLRLCLSGIAFLILLCCGAFSAGAAASASASLDKPTVLVVVGAPGEEDYGKNFAQWAGLWEKAGVQAGARFVSIGLKTNGAAADRELLQQALSAEPKEAATELWLVFLGHGTFDSKEAKFNLRGPDISATELAKWLEPFKRPLAVINTASASGPFLNSLSGPRRVIVTGTKSGSEQNYARFGQYISEAIGGTEADLDKDGQTSLLEAYLFAARGTAEFYTSEGRLATEHALLDDNGDGLGTPASWFRGVRAVKKAKEGAPLDGLKAHQVHLIRSEADGKMPAEIRARRDQLEVAISKLRDAKPSLDEGEYYRQLETLLIEMAELYEKGAGSGK